MDYRAEIKRAIKKGSLTQRAVADKAGINRGQFSAFLIKGGPMAFGRVYAAYKAAIVLAGGRPKPEPRLRIASETHYRIQLIVVAPGRMSMQKMFESVLKRPRSGVRILQSLVTVTGISHR